MEYILSEYVIWGTNLAHVSKVPFGLLKGGPLGGEWIAKFLNVFFLQFLKQSSSFFRHDRNINAVEELDDESIAL